MRSVDIEEFLELIEADHSVFDVRTPAEFEKGHLLGAQTLPVFSNEERAVVGTLYKQEGRRKAILEGLDFVGPKMRDMVEHVQRLAGPPDQEVLVHCWRGGMRSSSVGWLLELYGYRVTRLEGGYKAFRRWVRAQLDEPPPLRVIGGPTGVGKTEILWALQEIGEPVIDLEGLANHRGSAFGGLLLSEQPTQQHFENRLAMAYQAAKTHGVPVWIEDESRLIGSRHLPNALVDALQAAPIFFLEAPIDERIGRLVDVYGEAPPELLRESFDKIKKRLGGLRAKEAKQAVDAGDVAEAARLALRYYDKAYDRALAKRDDDTVRLVDVQQNPAAIARRLISMSQEQQR